METRMEAKLDHLPDQISSDLTEALSRKNLSRAVRDLAMLANYLNSNELDANSIRIWLPPLEDLFRLIDFYTNKLLPVSVQILPAPSHVKCALCDRISSELDACLLRVGELWLCRDHNSVPEGTIKPSGWRPPITESERLEAERKLVLSKLTHQERWLINSRIIR